MPAWVKSPQLAAEPIPGTKWERVLGSASPGVPARGAPERARHRSRAAPLEGRGAVSLRFSGTLRKIVILGHLALVSAGFWE